MRVPAGRGRRVMTSILTLQEPHCVLSVRRTGLSHHTEHTSLSRTTHVSSAGEIPPTPRNSLHQAGSDAQGVDHQPVVSSSRQQLCSNTHQKVLKGTLVHFTQRPLNLLSGIRADGSCSTES